MILGDGVTFDMDAAYVDGLRSEHRLKPFRSLVHALDTSISFQAAEAREAKHSIPITMLLCISAAVGLGFAYQAQLQYPVVLAGTALAYLIFKLGLEVGRRNAFESELSLMERRLLDAGFKLKISKSPYSNFRNNVTLDWGDT